MATPAPQSPALPQTLLQLTLTDDFTLTVHAARVLVISIAVFGIVALVIWFWRHRWRPVSDFEIDEAEFGFGNHKVKFRPNALDREVAYKIWVELSTRKIGLPINPEDDVIAEIYDSWHTFFSITRELIKDIPITKVRMDSTKKIIQLSIEVLNQGLRPHLTKWQARFRRWYEHQLSQDPNAALHPQDIQKKFPAYDELIAEMLEVNRHLMHYRDRMFDLVNAV